MAGKNDFRCSSFLIWGLGGAFALPMAILFIGAMVDPDGYIGDLTWTLCPGFIAGLAAYLVFVFKESDNQSLTAKEAKQGAANASGKVAAVSQTSKAVTTKKAATTKQSSPSKASGKNQRKTVAHSAHCQDILKRISVCLDDKDADTVHQLISKPVIILSGQQQQAAELYVKAVEKIGLFGVSRIMHTAFGGTPDYTKEQEDVIRLILPFLVDSGLNPNAKIDGAPLIHCAIQASNGSDVEDAVELLINKGADVNSTNDEGLSALGAHLVRGCVSDGYRFESYLSHGAKLNSCDLSNLQLYRTIMESGLDNVFSTISDNDIRQVIESSDDPSGVFLLLAAVRGVYVQSSDPAFMERRRQQYEDNPGYVNIVNRLLDLGIDPNRSPEPGVPTAIEVAMALRHDKVADCLLRYAR